MTTDMDAVIEASEGKDKAAFIEEAVDAFRVALNDPNRTKHAVFLMYDEADGKLQTYTFNADLNTLLMMVTSAYEMLHEAEGGPQRTLN
jgi:hypothetical protein